MKIRPMRFPGIKKPYGCHIDCGCNIANPKEIYMTLNNTAMPTHPCLCGKVVFVAKFILRHLSK